MRYVGATIHFHTYPFNVTHLSFTLVQFPYYTYISSHLYRYMVIPFIFTLIQTLIQGFPHTFPVLAMLSTSITAYLKGARWSLVANATNAVLFTRSERNTRSAEDVSLIGKYDTVLVFEGPYNIHSFASEMLDCFP